MGLSLHLIRTPLGKALAVGTGGFVGSILRFALGQALSRTGVLFPVGTLAANVIGCFVIGLVAGRLRILSLETAAGEALVLRSEFVTLFFVVGVLGGFTTFSTFALGVLDLGESGVPMRAVGYVLLSVGLGLLAAFVGLRLSGAVR